MAYTSRYFMPGEIVLTFDGSSPVTEEGERGEIEFFERLSEQDNEYFNRIIEGLGIEYDRPLANTLRNTFGNLSAREFDETPLKFGNHEHLFVQTNLSDKDLLLITIIINNAIRSELDSGNLRAVAPNWLMVASDPEQSGFGGPGTYPVRADKKDYCFTFYAGVKKEKEDGTETNEWGDFFQKYEKDTLAEANEAVAEEPESVVVAVLDTYPEKDHNGLNIANSVLNEIIGKVKPESVEVDEGVDDILNIMQENIEDPDKKGVHAKGHYYKMSSHGLFVTSLIYMIAPEAEIKVYRVLNDYGIGTTYTIMKGLEKALEDHDKSENRYAPLVINLSLTMTFPFLENQLPNNNDPENITELLRQIINEVKAEHKIEKGKWSFKNGTSRLASQLRYPIQSVIHWLYKIENVTIIAAAGNENRGGITPEASFPASFEEVIGVSALKNLNEIPTGDNNVPVVLTKYTSKADKPVSEGFAVFGGDINVQGVSQEQNPDEVVYKASSADEGGVVGIYIDNFPEPNGNGRYNTPNNNDTGWASWSGTSFATPIISGAIAKLVLCGVSFPVMVLQNTWKEIPSEDQTFADTPHVVLAMQNNCEDDEAEA